MNQLEPAIIACREGRTEEWIHNFLLNEGKNQPLSQGLKKQERYWVGPIEIEFSRIDRVVGPEEGMEYKEAVEDWNSRIEKMACDIKNGWLPPPLITEYRKGELSLRDGNHRMMALVKAGYDKYYTLVWFNTKGELEIFLNKK